MHYVSNIELDTLENRDFGPIVQYNDPSGHIQVALMSVPLGKSVPREVHSRISQFIRIERGHADLIMDGKTFEMREGSAAVIPAGTSHEIVNMGQCPLKLYTLYCKDAADAFEH
jgi:mannose-6-phosphate isomerase-like protein (cupin superfamily)